MVLNLPGGSERELAAERIESPALPPAPRPRRRSPPPLGTIAGVVLFTSIWLTSVSLFRLLALLVDLPDAPATALATVVAVWIVRRYFAGPALLDLGLRLRPGWLLDTALGLLLGPVMFLAILLVLLAAGWARVESGTIGASGLLTAFAVFVLVSFAEEVFARGWILQVLERGRGTRVAVIGSSAIFAALHGFNPDFSIMALLGLFLAGLLLGHAYVVTRQLWLPLALHLSWNFAEGPLFGFPVSGLTGEGLLLVHPTGPEFITGGTFGPEAGAVIVVGIAIAWAALMLLGWWRARPNLAHGAPPGTIMDRP